MAQELLPFYAWKRKGMKFVPVHDSVGTLWATNGQVSWPIGEVTHYVLVR